MGTKVLFGPGDEEGSDLVHQVQALEVQVGTVHDVDGSRFRGEDVEHVDVVELAVGNVHEARDGSAQVQQCVQFHGRLGGSEVGPGKDGQAQVDRGGVQGIDGIGQLYGERFAGIEPAGTGDEALGKIRLDAPVATLVGSGQGGASHRRRKAGMVELGGMGRQARFDVTQALPQRELGEGESAEVLGARQVADSPVPGVTVCDASEGRPRKEAHDLSEESFASVHPDRL